MVIVALVSQAVGLASILQGSGRGVIFRMGSGAVFDLVSQDEVGAGVTSSGGGEVLAQLRDSGGGAPGRQGVQADGQDTVAWVDVTAAGQRLTGQGECFAVGAGAPGVDADGAGQAGLPQFVGIFGGSEGRFAWSGA